MPYEFVVLVEGAMGENGDPVIRPRLAVSKFKDFGFNVDRIPVEQRLRETHLVPPEVRHRGSRGGIAYGDPDHESECQAAVHQRLAELSVPAVLGIDVNRRGIVGERAEPDVVSLGDGAAYRMPERLPDLKFLEVQTRHAKSPELRNDLAS